MAIRKKTKSFSNLNEKKVKTQKLALPSLPLKAISEKQTKLELLKSIAEQTGLKAKQVRSVFLITGHLAKCHLITKGSGEFSIPEMAIKITRKTKPATKARDGKNPFTGEAIRIPAKPKRDVIKIKPLKALKEAIA